MEQEFKYYGSISYASMDNAETPPWVIVFYEKLKVRVGIYIGSEAKIWMDRAMEGAPDLADEIREVLAQSYALIPIISPSYVKDSEGGGGRWPKNELVKFFDFIKADSYRKIYKIEKLPVEENKQPQEVRSLHGYRFYEFDEITGKVIPYEPQQLRPTKKGDFYQVLDDVAQDIANDIKKNFRPQSPQGSDTAHRLLESKGSVYLASCSEDMDNFRAMVKRELIGHGFEVLPQERFLDNSQIKANIDKSLLSVHIVSPNSKLLDASTRSVIEQQFDEAVKRATMRTKAEKFQSIVWAPDAKLSEDSDTELVEKILQRATRQNKSEFLPGSIEELKSTVLQRANEIIASKQEANDDRRSASLVFEPKADKDRLSELSRIVKIIASQKFNVVVPTLDTQEMTSKDRAQASRDFEEKSLKCDTVVVYYGAGRQAWFEQKWEEIDKRDIMRKRSTEKPIRRIIVLDEPSTPHKSLCDALYSGDNTLVIQREDDVAAKLETFL